MRTIQVTGTGRLTLKPDMTRIMMTLTGTEKEYGDAVAKTSEQTAKLAEVFAAFGFAREDLKTTSFNIDTEYEGYDENGIWKQRFAGYRYNHSLKIEFDSDNDRLGKILYALVHCDLTPEFRIMYTVKDPEAARKELLEMAVADAKKNADILAEAAGLAVTDIQNIEYSHRDIGFVTAPVNRMMLAKGVAEDAASYNIDIEPDGIEISDSVTIIWEIGWKR